MELEKNTPITVQPKDLTEMFSISRSTVTRVLNRMLLDAHYSKGVARINNRLTLVDVKLFKEFIFKQDMQGLKA